MQASQTRPLTRIHELREQVRILACVETTEAPFVSCYLDLSRGRQSWRAYLDQHAELLRAGLQGETLADFDQAMEMIETSIEDGLNQGARGMAIFARGSWGGRFLLSMQFAVPVENSLGAYPAPDVYPLLALLDNYDRYLLVVVRPDATHALDINLGAASVRAWVANDFQLSDRSLAAAGDRSSEPHEDIAEPMPGQARMVERLMRELGRGGLFLAGHPALTRSLAHSLSTSTARRVIDLLPEGRARDTDSAVQTSLDRFTEFEEHGSRLVAGRVVHAKARGGQAVTGEQASMRALVEGRADTLVMVAGYQPTADWRCTRCDEVFADGSDGRACPACGGPRVEPIDLRIELARLAAQQGVAVEVVESDDALNRHGGVGCLLRSPAEQPGLEPPKAALDLRRVA